MQTDRFGIITNKLMIAQEIWHGDLDPYDRNLVIEQVGAMADYQLLYRLCLEWIRDNWIDYTVDCTVDCTVDGETLTGVPKWEGKHAD